MGQGVSLPGGDLRKHLALTLVRAHEARFARKQRVLLAALFLRLDHRDSWRDLEELELMY